MSVAERVEVSLAGDSDMPAVRALVEEAGLPVAGLDQLRESVVVARRGGSLVGTAALEFYPPAALLRSVAVNPTHRGRGVGRTLTQRSLELATTRGIERVYLLTETAAPFFSGLGFVSVDRAAVDPAVRQSLEFTTLCPESAQAMVREVP